MNMINIPLLEIRKQKRFAYVVVLSAAIAAVLLAKTSLISQGSIYMVKNIILPGAFIVLLVLLIVTLQGKRLDIVEFGLFGLASIALLALLVESMLSDPIDMLDLSDALYWFVFVYLLGFLVLKPPYDWIVLSVFLFLTILTGLMHFTIYNFDTHTTGEIAFLARFYLAQISLFAVTFSLFRLNEGSVRLKAAGDAWEKLALTDSLTQINNRMALSYELDRELAQVQRHQRISSILMMDIDNFKKINDNFGHATGDNVLIAVAETIRDLLREGDFLARFGGDEFIAILPETDEASARLAAERIGKHVAELHVEQLKQLGISIGVSKIEANSRKQDVFKKVDERLYQAKEKD